MVAVVILCVHTADQVKDTGVWLRGRHFHLVVVFG